MESLTVKADLVNLDMVLDFAKRILEKQNAPAEVITQMQFCMDEMFANITKYAYPDKNGMVIVSADTGQQGEIVFVLEDEGIPYNPLEQKQPIFTPNSVPQTDRIPKTMPVIICFVPYFNFPKIGRASCRERV